MGWGGHGSYCSGRRVFRFAPTDTSPLAFRLADRIVCRRGHCCALFRHKSASRQCQAPRSSSGSVAATLRNRDRNCRIVFCTRRSHHGALLDAPRRHSAFCSAPYGRSVHGLRFRVRPDRIRDLDRFAVWRLTNFRMAKSTTVRHEHTARERSGAFGDKGPNREAVSPDLDRLIHERIRLGIVSALAVNRSLTFNELKALLKTTDGNLSVHARRLEEADYIICNKSFDGRLPKTEYRLTSAGRRALERYLNHMEALIRATREA